MKKGDISPMKKDAFTFCRRNMNKNLRYSEFDKVGQLFEPTYRLEWWLSQHSLQPKKKASKRGLARRRSDPLGRASLCRVDHSRCPSKR